MKSSAFSYFVSFVSRLFPAIHGRLPNFFFDSYVAPVASTCLYAKIGVLGVSYV